jgi:iron complex outermembrane receptor protein
MAAALLAGAAQAQSANEASKLEEIVVTAQRRAERLQDVPMSITALSADALQRAGIASTADLARASPSVNMPFYGGFLQPSIRGVSSTGANIGDNSNVALYIDGVYQPQQIATLIDLPDIEQVEILKGPQGALYGQNATGGAILVNSRAPSFTPTGYASASYGNYNDVNLRGFVSGPITDKIAFSLAGGFQQREGFRRHVITDQRDEGLNSKVVRGKVLFEPTDRIKLTLTGYYSDRSDSSAYAGFALNGNSTGYAFFPTAPKATDPKQFATDPGVFVRTESYGANLHGEFTLDAGTVNTITGYFRNQTKYLADADYSPINFARASTNDLHAHYFMQEANFVSRKFGPVSFLAGGFYLDGAEVFNTSDFTITAPTLPPAPYSSTVLTFLPEFGVLNKRVWAVYGDVTYDITDKLILTAGGRYTEERQEALANLWYLPLPARNTIVSFPGGPQTWSKFTPRVTLRYEITPTSNVYASWGKGFKSGLINTANFAQPPVNPERITSYEIGYKGRPVSNLTFNLALFSYDYTDLQVVAYAPPDYINQNAASARIKGVDVDGSWVVTPDLTLSGAVSYLDAHYESFPAAQVFIPTGFGNNPVTEDLSGHRLLRAPKWTGNLSADYHHDTDIGRVSAFVAGYYNSGYGFEVSNRIRTGTFVTLDSELRFEPVQFQGLRLSLWGKNLTNKAYLSTFLVSQLADGVGYAAPRTFGVRAEYNF